MATIEKEADTTRRNQLLLAVLGAIGCIVLYFSLRSPPQMGTSEEVFNTVDALYTAVRNEDEKQLTNCEQRLRATKDAGKLPSSAWNYLSDVIATARSGRWRRAAESLYEFMKVQRREGEIEHSHEKKGKTPKTK